KAAAQCHGGLWTFVAVTVQFVDRAAHRESVGRDEHHVRGRALQSHAVKFLRGEMGGYIREEDATESVVHNAQLTPDRKISRGKDGVNARRTGDGKLKRSNRLSQPDELNRQRVGEHRNALIA